MTSAGCVYHWQGAMRRVLVWTWVRRGAGEACRGQCAWKGDRGRLWSRLCSEIKPRRRSSSGCYPPQNLLAAPGQALCKLPWQSH